MAEIELDDMAGDVAAAGDPCPPAAIVEEPLLLP
jgi:hypothetical protein